MIQVDLFIFGSHTFPQKKCISKNECTVSFFNAPLGMHKEPAESSSSDDEGTKFAQEIMAHCGITPPGVGTVSCCIMPPELQERRCIEAVCLGDRTNSGHHHALHQLVQVPRSDAVLQLCNAIRWAQSVVVPPWQFASIRERWPCGLPAFEGMLIFDFEMDAMRRISCKLVVISQENRYDDTRGAWYWRYLLYMPMLPSVPCRLPNCDKPRL
jgi:hypothetical protein